MLLSPHGEEYAIVQAWKIRLFRIEKEG